MTVWRYILHADLDAFYASVEQHDNPALRGRPVAVGGPPEARGVVAAASYEARHHGVRSAMPMRTALRLCPELVRVSARFDRYREVSQAVMGIFHDLTPLVEPLSMDEAYLDVSAQVPPEHLEKTGRDLKARVREVTGLAVTIGGGTSKSVAKIASQQAKPDGLLLVAPGTEEAFLAPLEVSMLWGVGPVTTAMLNRMGIRTIAELAARDQEWLRKALGTRGPELQRRARGQDHDPVVPTRETKSVSAETTLAQDVSDASTLQTELAASRDGWWSGFRRRTYEEGRCRSSCGCRTSRRSLGRAHWTPPQATQPRLPPRRTPYSFGRSRPVDASACLGWV